MCASHLLNRWLHGASNTGEQEMVQVSQSQMSRMLLILSCIPNAPNGVLTRKVLSILILLSVFSAGLLPYKISLLIIRLLFTLYCKRNERTWD